MILVPMDWEIWKLSQRLLDLGVPKHQVVFFNVFDSTSESLKFVVPHIARANDQLHAVFQFGATFEYLQVRP